MFSIHLSECDNKDAKHPAKVNRQARDSRFFLFYAKLMKLRNSYKGNLPEQRGTTAAYKKTSDEFTSVSGFDIFIRLIDAVFGEFNEFKTDTLAHFE
jgi:hypothetical protein